MNINSNLITIDNKLILEDNKINDINSKLITNDTNILNINTNLTTIDNKLIINDSNISTINTHLTSIDNQINNLSNNSTITTINSHLTIIDNKLITNDTNISTINTNLTNINNKLTTNDTNLTNINNKLTTNDTNISNINNKLTTNDTNIFNINNKLIINDTNISTINTDLTNIKTKLTTNDTNISSININLTNVNTNLTNVNTKLTTNDTDILTINTHLTTLDNQITSVTSNLANNQTIIDLTNNKISKSGDTMTDKLLFNSGGIDVSDTNNLLEIGTKTKQKTIKIGNTQDDIKIMNNKLILDINKNIDSIINQSNNDIGFIIKDNNNELGYIKSSNDYKSFNIKPPKSTTQMKIKEQITDPFDIVYKLYTDIQNTNLLSSITSMTDQYTNINNQISQINNNLINSILYNKIINFPSNNNNILLGDGTYSKLTNNQINDNSISINKLIKSNNQNELLCGDGLFRSLDNISSFMNYINNLRLNNILTDNNLDINNNRITNISNGINNKDAINLEQLNEKIINLNNYLPNNSLNINKIIFNGDGSQVLCSDGQWRSQSLQTLLFNGNNTYEYTIPIKNINEIYNNISNIQNQFYLIYTIRILNSTKKIKTSCKIRNGKVIQSGLTLNNQPLYIDNTVITNTNINTIYKKTNTSYDGSVYLTDNSNNYLNNTINIRIGIVNGVISQINNNPYGYKLSVNNDKYYSIPFILTNINLFFNKTNYYMSNDNNIYNWDSIAINYLSQFTFDLVESKIYTSNDSVNNFIIYIIGSNNYLDCNIDLTTNTIISTLNNITDYFNSNTNLNDQILSYEQNFNIDGNITYNKLNKYYYNEINYIDLITNSSKMYIIDSMTNILYLMNINNNGNIIYNKTNIYKL